MDVGRSLVTVLDPEAVLERLLEVARELTGARYAAIGVLDERREQLERFLTAGIDDETHRAIGDLPRGRGVLGVLITRSAAAAPRRRRRAPAVLRLPARAPGDDDVPRRADHHRREGLGQPLPDREGRPASSPTRTRRRRSCSRTGRRSRSRNARLYRTVRERRDELERTIRGLETTTEISRALGGVTDLDRVLELVVKRSRALIDARAAEIALRRGRRVRARRAWPGGMDGLKGRDPGDSLRIADRRQQRFADPGRSLPRAGRDAIVAPMIFRDRRRLPDRVDRPRRPAVQRGGRAAAAGVRGQRGDRRGDGPERQRGGAAARRSRPPRPSARAGRASCTTRRCSSSPACACCSPARAAAATRPDERARSTARWSRSRPRSATCAR